MSDKTTNQIIHEWLGECWHERSSAPSKWGWDLVSRCSKCGSIFKTEVDPEDDNPDYTDDLNEVAKIEAKIIETFGDSDYYVELVKLCHTQGWTPNYHSLAMHFCTAPASVRCQAIVNLIQEKENE